MFRKTTKILVYTILFLLFISGCQENPAVPTSVAQVENTATVSAASTATEIPPSSTPMATYTPNVTPTSTAIPTSTPTSTPASTPSVIDVMNANKLTKSSWGDGTFTQIAWSSDGQQLLLATTNEIQWLDSRNFDVLNTISVDTLYRPEFDTTTSMIADGLNGKIDIWDLESASLQFSLEGLDYFIHNTVFSPDGQILASSEADGTVRLWDMTTGELQYEFTDIALPSEFEEPSDLTEFNHPKIDISPDGKSLVIGVNIKTYLPERNSYHDSSNIQVFDLQTGIFQRILTEYRDEFIQDITFSSDGQIIGVVIQSGASLSVEFRNSTTGFLIDTVSGYVRDFAFAPDMSMFGLASTGRSGGTITLRDIDNNKTMGLPIGLLETPSIARNLAFSPDSTKIAAHDSGWVRIWDVETQEVLQTKQLDSPFSYGVSGMNPVSNIIATNPNGTPDILLRDLQTGQILQTLTDGATSEGYTSCLVFSPDNQYLAKCTSTGLVKMWDIISGNLMYTINFQQRIGHISFNPDGETFIVRAGGYDMMMTYNVVTGQTVQNTNFATDSSPKFSNFTYSPDGSFIAALGGKSDVDSSLPDVLVFDSESKSQIISVPTGRGYPPFTWHPTEPIIAVGRDDGTIQLVDIITGGTVQEVYDESRIIGLTFNPDGTLLVSMSLDGTIVWDVATGEVIQKIDDIGLPSFTTDGRVLVLLGDNEVFLWQVHE